MNLRLRDRLCPACERPVERDHDLFERMHWICFHFEFEHHTYPDDPCDDPSCPIAAMQKVA